MADRSPEKGMTTRPAAKPWRRFWFIVCLIMSGFVEYPFIIPMLTPAVPSKGNPFIFALFGLPLLAVIWGVYFLIIRRTEKLLALTPAERERQLTPPSMAKLAFKNFIVPIVAALALVFLFNLFGGK